MKFLITGIGGDIGFNIGRILRESYNSIYLVGSDLHNQLSGEETFNRVIQLPPCSDTNYLEKLKECIRSNSIDIFIPGSEPELRFFFARPEESIKLGCKLITANQQSMKIGFDKLKTSEFLRDNFIRAPWTVPVDRFPEGPPQLPCILKSRTGSGSSSVKLIHTKEEVNIQSTVTSEYIYQEYIPDTNGEYTCGVYRCLDESTRVVILKRRLSSGLTSYAEVIHNERIFKLCEKIANLLNLKGAINIQLRLDASLEPLVFEINPRFSSTIMMRHMIGFKDLVWSIEEQYLGQGASSAPNKWPIKKFARRYVERFV